MISFLVLCVQLFSVFAARPPPPKGHGRRLNDYNELVGELPEACTVQDFDCDSLDRQEFEVEEHLTFEDANALTSRYCCAIRRDSRDDLLRIAANFHSFCKLDWVTNVETGMQLNAAQLALLHYCDDVVTGEDFKYSQRISLWNLLNLDDHVQLHSCSKESAGDDTVTVHVSGFDYEDGNTHALIELEENEFYSWQPDVWNQGLRATQSLVEQGHGASLLDGVKATLSVLDTLQQSEASFTITGVNKETIKTHIQKIQTHKPLYSFIKYNCAHFVLEVLAEGLGCKSELLPFLSPIALADILKNHVLTDDIYNQRRNLATTLSKAAQRVSRLLNVGN